MYLLQEPPDPGYPDEYLQARIRGRRSTLIRDWKPLLADRSFFDAASPSRRAGLMTAGSADGIRDNLMREYRWLYGQMSRRLRAIFNSFFLHAELRTVFICFRHLLGKKTGDNEELLRRSMLADEVKSVLASSADAASAVKGMEGLFRSLSDRFEGLGKTLESEGLRGVEQRLTETYLELMVRSAGHRLMNRFFSKLVDARNIMSLYKYARLGSASVPPVIPGGSVPEARMRGLVAKEGIAGVVTLLREATGIAVERPDPAAVELACYRGMTRWLKKEGRDSSGPGPVLDYAWRCSIEATNLNILYQARWVERELVAPELVE